MRLWILRKKRTQNPGKKQEKIYIHKNLYALFEGRERVLDAFESKIFLTKVDGRGFSDKVSDHSNFKVLTPTQILWRLPRAPAQVKAVKTSEHLLHEIRQIIYSLYLEKESTKKYITNNDFNKSIIQRWILYLWILKTIKHIIFSGYYLILQIR